MEKSSLFVVAVVSLIAGCSRPAISTLPYDQMPPGDFVAIVNGNGYTKGELERDIAITETILTLAGLPKTEMVSQKDPSTFRRSVINGFIMREVILKEAALRQITLSSEEMESYQNQFVAELSGKMPLNFAAVLDALGKDATTFRNNLKKDALSAKAEAIFKNQIASTIPETDTRKFEQERQAILNANLQIEKDNRSLSKLATNAWKSIRAGNDFAVVGKKLPSLHKGITYEDELKDSAGQFANASAGITPPEATDDGLRLAKIDVLSDGTKRISAITFKLERTRTVPSLDEHAKAQRNAAINAKYTELLKAMKQSAAVSVISI